MTTATPDSPLAPAMGKNGNGSPFKSGMAFKAKAPANATTHSLVYDFQVFGRDTLDSNKLVTLTIRSKDEENAAFHARQCGLEIQTITQGSPVIPDREVLNGRDEVAAFLGIEPTTLTEWLGKGIFQRSNSPIKISSSGDIFATKSRLIDWANKIGLQLPTEMKGKL